ncbi:MAG TPA: hypothetical protein VGM75_34440 [Pseudonocardiaceae bacterium]|jgi:hypothetical protein
MNRNKIVWPLAMVGLLVAGCGAAAPSDGVPSLGGTSTQAAGGGDQAHALHAAAQCIRDHGVPKYQDPVVAPDGSVYTDQRSLEDASGDNRNFFDTIRTACQSQFLAANFNPSTEPKATPTMVAAGVRAAECMRAHGMTHFSDPTANSTFTPGHGFGISAGEIPAGGKADPTFQRAASACRALIDAEINASTLSSLSHG